MLRSIMTGLMMAALIVLVPQACSQETNTAPSTAGRPPTFAPGVEIPVGPFPRGTVDPAFALDPATQGPEVTVISPTRGAQLTARTIDVRLSVVDVNGVARVEVNGFPAQNTSGTEWFAQITLEANQVNFVQIESEDGLGNISTNDFSLTQGVFRPLDQYTDSIVGLSLNNTGLARAKMIAEDLTRNLDLNPLILSFNPLYDSFLAEINLASLANQPMEFSIEGAPNGAVISIDLDQADLALNIEALGSLITQRANLTATTARAIATARVQADLNNPPQNLKSALGLELAALDVQLLGFDVRFSSNLLTAIVSLLRGTVREIVEEKLEEILGDVINDTLGNQVLPGLGQPLTVELPIPTVGTSSIDLAFRASGANGSRDTGLGLALGARVTPTVQVLQGVTTNYFVTGTTAVPNVLMSDNFAAGLSSDTANAFIHALWLSGVLRLRLDGTNPQPDQTFSLSAKLLTPFFPQLTGLAPDPDTPIVLELTTEAAPTVRFGRQGSSVEFTINEFQVKALIDYMDGQPPLEIFTLTLNLQATADVQLQNNAIVISNLSAPVTSANLTNEPVTDLADQELVNFLNAIVPYALTKFKDKIPAFPIPALPLGLDLRNPRVEVQQDFVIVRGSL